MPNLLDTQATQIASYNYSDIARGTAVEVLYGGKWKDAETSGMILSNKLFYSDDIATGWAIHGGGGNRSVSFDMGFTNQRIIGGSAIFNIPVGVEQKATESGEIRISGMITLKKVSNGTEEEIAVGSTGVFAETLSQNSMAGHIFNSIITIPNTKFRGGDTLRVTINLYTTNAAPYPNSNMGIGHDPVNRSDDGKNDIDEQVIPDNTDTNLIIQIPFKIDV